MPGTAGLLGSPRHQLFPAPDLGHLDLPGNFGHPHLSVFDFFSPRADLHESVTVCDSVTGGEEKAELGEICVQCIRTRETFAFREFLLYRCSASIAKQQQKQPNFEEKQLKDHIQVSNI